MKQCIWKLFLNPEKEEKWINKMAQAGMGLSGSSLVKYEFEEILPGEYTYSIQLLDRIPEVSEFMRYLMILDRMNITCISAYYLKVYLRKSAMDAPSKINLDKASQLVYYKRIHKLYAGIILIDIIIALVFWGMTVVNLFSSRFNNQYGVNLLVITVFFVFAGIFGKTDYSILKIIKRLKEEQII